MSDEDVVTIVVSRRTATVVNQAISIRKTNLQNIGREDYADDVEELSVAGRVFDVALRDAS